MNHFVIANWYDPESPAILANANVKVMKYYSGAEISGTVMTEDDGLGLPNARILIERDAFSGEGAEDLDEDTYWIPIGVTDADENGDWSFLAPAGKIRVSAFAGIYDDTFVLQDIQSGDSLMDLATSSLRQTMIVKSTPLPPFSVKLQT